MKKIKLICLIIFTIAFNGCKKTETGPAGKDGNANVSATVFSVSSWSWSAPQYYSNLTVPEITSDNLTSSAIMAYFSKDNANWVALPFTQYNTPSNYFMGFNTSVGSVQITWIYDSSLSAGSNPNTFYSVGSTKFKIVVIPSAIKKTHPNIDMKNYKEVKRTFGLPD